MIYGVVFTHADLGVAFCEAVESMMGVVEGLIGLSNDGLSGESMSIALEEIVENWDDGVVIFTALYGGSCWQAAERLSRKRMNIHHLTGVNLPMLLAFVNKRSSMELGKLADILIEYGHQGIKP